MLNNEDVLVSLYEKLFPHRTGIARPSAIRILSMQRAVAGTAEGCQVS